MKYEDVLEKIAGVLHEAWEEWSKVVAPEVSEDRRARWEGFWVPYEQLDESTKDLDREWATKVMEAIESDLKDEEMGPPEEDEMATEEPLPMEEVEIEEGVKAAESKKSLEMVTKVNVDASKYPSVSKALAAKTGSSMLAKVRADAAE